MGIDAHTHTHRGPFNKVLNPADPLTLRFFSINTTTKLLDLQLIQSADAELDILRADYKVLCGFSIVWMVSTPDPLVVEGLTE